MFYQSEDLQRTAEFMVKECNLRMENFEEAVSWLENEVSNPNNYADSICALIDLGFINTLMVNSGLKSVREFAPNGARLPNTKKQNEQWYIGLLMKLFLDHNIFNRELPENPNTSSNITLTSFGPNPLYDDLLTIGLASEANDFVILNIHSADGRLVKTSELHLEKGKETEIKIHLKSIPSGIFLVRITSTISQDVLIRKLIIQ